MMYLTKKSLDQSKLDREEIVNNLRVPITDFLKNNQHKTNFTLIVKYKFNDETFEALNTGQITSLIIWDDFKLSKHQKSSIINYIINNEYINSLEFRSSFFRIGKSENNAKNFTIKDINKILEKKSNLISFSTIGYKSLANHKSLRKLLNILKNHSNLKHLGLIACFKKEILKGNLKTAVTELKNFLEHSNINSLDLTNNKLLNDEYLNFLFSNLDQKITNLNLFYCDIIYKNLDFLFPNNMLLTLKELNISCACPFYNLNIIKNLPLNNCSNLQILQLQLKSFNLTIDNTYHSTDSTEFITTLARILASPNYELRSVAIQCYIIDNAFCKLLWKAMQQAKNQGKAVFLSILSKINLEINEKDYLYKINESSKLNIEKVHEFINNSNEPLNIRPTIT